MTRPQTGEYNPYFQGYIDEVPEGDFLQVLHTNTQDAIAFFEGIPAGKQDYRYAEGKWSIKELLMHIIDAERVFCYRALVAARGDSKTLLCSMDDHLYLQNALVQGRIYTDLVAEFKAVRSATEALFSSLSESQSLFPANTDAGIITARALGHIIIGHMRHHMRVIRERYL